MTAPVVTSTPATVTPRQRVEVVGTGFGFAAGVFLYDATDQTYVETGGFQVQDGEHLAFTVRPDTPLGVYSVIVVDLDDEDGTTTAPSLTVVAAQPPPTPTPPSQGVPAPLVAALRFELQDNPRSFQEIATGDGITSRYELAVQPVDPTSLNVLVRANGTTPADENPTITHLVLGTDYTIDAQAGVITTTVPVDDLALLIVSGTAFRYFLDTELAMFIQTAFNQQSLNRYVTDHTIDPITGFKSNTTRPFDYTDLPQVEILPLTIQAKIQALWVLATDAMTDIDISEDGASIPVTERYRQLMQQIAAETARYTQLAELLNIGLAAIEMFTLRRVSRTTGRFIPIYVEKEYDDYSPPVRVYPVINHGDLGGSEMVDPYYTVIGP